MDYDSPLLKLTIHTFSKVKKHYTFPVGYPYSLVMALFSAHNFTHCALWQYGLWSFLALGTKLERCFPKNQHTQRNFENWVNGEVSKSAKMWLSKSIFYVKIIGIFLNFVFIEEYQCRSTSFVINILKTRRPLFP